MAGRKNSKLLPFASEAEESGVGLAQDFDAVGAVDVTVRLTGAKASIAADYATLVTNATALGTCSTIDWNKR